MIFISYFLNSDCFQHLVSENHPCASEVRLKSYPFKKRHCLFLVESMSLPCEEVQKAFCKKYKVNVLYQLPTYQTLHKTASFSSGINSVHIFNPSLHLTHLS